MANQKILTPEDIRKLKDLYEAYWHELRCIQTGAWGELDEERRTKRITEAKETSKNLKADIDNIRGIEPIPEEEKEVKEIGEELLSIHAEIKSLKDESKEEEDLGYWLPYIQDQVSLGANEDTVLYIEDDNQQGLGEPGREGKIENYGPGLLQYRITSEEGIHSKIRTLYQGAWDGYRVEEKVKIRELYLKADDVGTVYSVIMSAKAPNGGDK